MAQGRAVSQGRKVKVTPGRKGAPGEHTPKSAHKFCPDYQWTVRFTHAEGVPEDPTEYRAVESRRN